MLVMILSVSLTLPYLGPERFGVWMTIASFAGFLGLLDLGMGNALTNRVAKVAAINSPERLPSTISGGIGLMFLLGFAVASLLFLVASLIPWNNVFKLSSEAVITETRAAAQCFGILFGLQLFSNSVSKIFSGLQQSYYVHIWAGICSILSALTLYFAASRQAGIPTLLVIVLGGQCAPALVLILVLRLRQLLYFNGILTAVQRESKNLIGSGGMFLVLQIGTMVGWGVDSVIIASSLGASQVAVYSIVQRLFQFVSQPLSVMNAPLWGAYADAHARNETVFIRSTVWRSVSVTGVLASLIGLVVFMLHEKAIGAWTTNTISAPDKLVLAVYIFTVVEAMGSALAMMLNGCGIIRIQVVAVVLFCTLAIPAKLLAVNFSLEAFVATTLLTYIVTMPLFYATLGRKAITKGMVNG